MNFLQILGEYKGSQYYDNVVPVVPHSWYHVCLGLDTVSGLLRISVNGHLIENEEKEFFRDTAIIKPKSAARKFLGKFFNYLFSPFLVNLS